MQPFDHLKPFPCNTLYKDFFSYAEFMKIFIEEYLPKKISKGLDIEKMEIYPSKCLYERYEDEFSGLVWRVPIQNKEAFAYFILDFRSAVDYLAAIRFSLYQANLAQDTVQDAQEYRKLPRIYPILIYTGREKWDVPINKDELFENGFYKTPIAPSEAYILIEITQLKEEIEKKEDLVSELFKVENAKSYSDAHWQFRRVIRQFSEDKHYSLRINFLIHDEKMSGRDQGIKEAIIEAIPTHLKSRFNTQISEKSLQKLKRIGNSDTLIQLFASSINIASLEDFEKQLDQIIAF